MHNDVIKILFLISNLFQIVNESDLNDIECQTWTLIDYISFDNDT